VKILYDTNVILDVLLNRQPHVALSAPLVAKVETGRISGALCATTVTTVFYFVEKQLGAAVAQASIKRLLSIFEVAAITRSVLEAALNDGFTDFEDAVLHQAALSVGAHGIVTRNGPDFKKSTITVYSPAELEAALIT